MSGRSTKRVRRLAVEEMLRNEAVGIVGLRRFARRVEEKMVAAGRPEVVRQREVARSKIEERLERKDRRAEQRARKVKDW